MAIGRRAGERDHPVDGNDPPQGQDQAAQVTATSTNGNLPVSQERRSPEPSELPAPTTSSEQPEAAADPGRDICNPFQFFQWLTTNKDAQKGVEDLLRSFARYVLLPLIVLAALLLLILSMPHTSLALKIIPSALTTAGIGFFTWMTKRKPK